MVGSEDPLLPPAGEAVIWLWVLTPLPWFESTSDGPGAEDGCGGGGGGGGSGGGGGGGAGCEGALD